MHIITRIIFLFFVVGLSSFKGYSQTSSFTIEMKGATLKDILKKIENNSNYIFVFNERLDMEVQKDIHLIRMPVTETLNSVFEGTGISWQIMENHIVLNKAKKIIISGYVTNRNSMETLIGASIYNRTSGTGSFSNAYGYYSFQTNSDSIDLQISYIGCKSLSKKFFARRDTVIHFCLEESDIWLQDVTIYNTQPFSPAGSSVELTDNDIYPMPAAFGENDVFKSLETIPGIWANRNGSSGLSVRGGSPDQNLILIDGVPVYNTEHTQGSFSILNGDAVKKVFIYKGSFPARYSGRLSSVVDIRVKEGDMQHFHSSVTIGTLAARINAEGPIIKGKTSFSISARRSYLDDILNLWGSTIQLNDSYYTYIYDINAKINHKFSDRSRLYLSFYKGRDTQTFNDQYSEHENNTEISHTKEQSDYNWGNDIISLRWNYVFNNQLFVNTTAAYNRYQFDSNASFNKKYYKQELNHTSFQKSGIEDWQINSDFEYQPNNNHYIRFGGGVIRHHFNPETYGSQAKQTDDNNQEWMLNYHLYNPIKGYEMSLYAEDEFSISPKLKANLGAHFSLFEAQGKFYPSLQPRLSLGYELTPKTTVKISYAKMNQYMNLLSSNMSSQPTDLWVPITKKLKPMTSHQFSAGLFFDANAGYRFSAEGFYKQMSHLLEYKDGMLWKDATTSWEEYVESGKGWIYGVELLAQKTRGRFTGGVGYTLSWNKRRFETINKGCPYWDRYDSRHHFNITGAFKYNNKIDFYALWMYATGSRTTLPLEEYASLPIFTDQSETWSHLSVTNINSYNNYKMSDIHHLDIGMNYRRSERKIWTFGIYNVYNRFNPYCARVGIDNNVIESARAKIVPSVSFTYKFK